MKQKMIGLFAVALLLASTTFATKHEDPSPETLNEFSRMFTNTTHVEWIPVVGFYQVTFKQAGQYLTAYYNTSDEFVSLSRNISTTMLPLLLQNKLAEKLSSSWVTESFELSGNNGTEYYVTVENADTKTVYQSNGADWSVYKRLLK